MIKNFFLICVLLFLSPLLRAAELSGVVVDNVLAAKNGDTLILNGMGLREKLWVDVYVGSLYLTAKTSDVAEILASEKAWRIQMDFVYKKVDKEKLITAWREGFEKNQPPETLQNIESRIQAFYDYFDQDVVAKDQFKLDYLPEQGTTITKNDKVLGTISGTDFKNALLEIWLGEHPADRDLKKGMLGIN